MRHGYARARVCLAKLEYYCLDLPSKICFSSVNYTDCSDYHSFQCADVAIICEAISFSISRALFGPACLELH